MPSILAVHPKYLPRPLKVVLHHRQELAHLVAGYRVALAVPAVAFETAHPFSHAAVGVGVGVRWSVVWRGGESVRRGAAEWRYTIGGDETTVRVWVLIRVRSGGSGHHFSASARAQMECVLGG